MPPPTKRQKRLIVLGPDKGNNEVPVSSGLDKNEVPNTILERPSLDDSTTSTLASRFHGRSKTDRNSQWSISTEAFPTLVNTTQQHRPSKLSAPPQSQASRAISSFFGPASQTQPPSHSKLSKAVSPEPKYETEDLIEDDSPVEDGERLPRTQSKILDGQRGPCKEKAGSFGSGRFKLAGNAIELDANSPITRQNVHATPWADRFGPSDLKELMVHKKKVTDVQTWLESVLQGRNRKVCLRATASCPIG